MMKSIIVMSVALMMMSGAARSDNLATAEVNNYRVFLSELPSLNKVYRYYPPTALNRGVNGVGEIECQWTDQGRLTKCRVLNEAPKGYGFGKATAEIFEKYARVDVEATRNQPIVPKTTKLRFSWIFE